jgi:hypothetical protein
MIDGIRELFSFLLEHSELAVMFLFGFVLGIFFREVFEAVKSWWKVEEE